VCLVNVACCQVDPRRADHSSRGVLSSVVRVTECDRESSIMKESLTHQGLLRHKKNLQIISTVILVDTIIIIIIYLVFQRSTKVDIELVIR